MFDALPKVNVLFPCPVKASPRIIWLAALVALKAMLYPTATFPWPVVTVLPLSLPTPVFFVPVVTPCKAVNPIAVFSPPVVIFSPDL